MAEGFKDNLRRHGIILQAQGPTSMDRDRPRAIKHGVAAQSTRFESRITLQLVGGSDAVAAGEREVP